MRTSNRDNPPQPLISLVMLGNPKIDPKTAYRVLIPPSAQPTRLSSSALGRKPGNPACEDRHHDEEEEEDEDEDVDEEDGDDQDGDDEGNDDDDDDDGEDDDEKDHGDVKGQGDVGYVGEDVFILFLGTMKLILNRERLVNMMKPTTVMIVMLTSIATMDTQHCNRDQHF